MKKDIQTLRNIGTTSAGAFLREYLPKVIERRCNVMQLEDEADLKAAKKVFAILQEDILMHLEPKVEETEEPLANQYD